MSYSLKTEIEKTKNLFLLCVVCISDVVKGFFFSTLSPEDYNPDVGRILRPQFLRAKTFTYCSSRNPFSFVYCVAPFVSSSFSHPLLAKAVDSWGMEPFKLFEVILELFERIVACMCNFDFISFPAC